MIAPTAMTNPIKLGKRGRSTNEVRRRAAGAWLRAVRNDRKLTQHELAQKVGCPTYTLISQLESGKSSLQSFEYEVWAEALSIPLFTFALYCTYFYHFYTYIALFDRQHPEQVLADRGLPLPHPRPPLDLPASL